MAAAAVFLLIAAAVSYFYAFIGWSVARRFPNLFEESMFVDVKPLGRFQVLRQRSIVRQGRVFTKVGNIAAIGAALALIADLLFRFA